MSKFNASTENTMKTVNHEGYTAYRMDWKTKLITMVLTSFFNEQKFYGDNSEELTNCLRSGIVDDPQFVSNLAIFARREFNMRSVSHVIAGYLANVNEGKPFVKRTVKNIVLRGDDATEILSFYLSTFGKPIPNSLRKALREVFPTFDEYTLAKYKGEGKSVKMRDILCLCRPHPTSEEQSKIWKDLLEGTIKPAYTWETELSAKGNNKETWEDLIASGKVGYMALLRNLRNILNANPENLDKVLNVIGDPEAVRKSKQFPFRYLSAYREVLKLDIDSRIRNMTLNTLENAVDASIHNIPRIPGKTMIAIDVSGSMDSPISSRSDIRCCDISTMLGVIASKICEDSVVYKFDHRIQPMHIPMRNGVLDTVMNSDPMGGGTDMTLPFKQMIEDFRNGHGDYDRIIILSDNECNRAGAGGWRGDRTVQQMTDEFRRESGKNLWVHAVDLLGYGTQQFAGARTNIIAGWSEKIFDFILLAEQGIDSLEKRINEYTPC